MSRIAFAAALAACFGFCGSALATDLSLKDTPEYSYDQPALWAGFYFGIHAGGARGDVNVSDTFDYNGDPHAENSYDASGAIVGLQLGYNFQQGNLVYGVEADLGYLDLSGSKYFDLPNPTGKALNEIGATYSLSGGLYGDLTARVGYAADNLLLYVKGGAAFLNVDTKSHYEGANCGLLRTCNGPRTPSTFDFDDSEMLLGWTLGVGAEYALSSSLSLKVEYQHFDFGNASSSYQGTDSFKCGSSTCSSILHGNVDVSPTVDAVKVGLNYKFNGGDEPLK